ncbi:hypothetical protein HY417_00330 [Candidatus Kaiserbacteria bacterium]|nr:hypothetical protein [Candidatus Kaiserbacteria bacterium]
MANVAELEKKIQKMERELSDLRARLHEQAYELSEWERSEVQRGLADDLATDKEVQAVLRKYGLSFAV